jgi:hypothetical protein
MGGEKTYKHTKKKWTVQVSGVTERPWWLPNTETWECTHNIHLVIFLYNLYSKHCLLQESCAWTTWKHADMPSYNVTIKIFQSKWNLKWLNNSSYYTQISNFMKFWLAILKFFCAYRQSELHRR